jgi:hypothetical protein
MIEVLKLQHNQTMNIATVEPLFEFIPNGNMHYTCLVSGLPFSFFMSHSTLGTRMQAKLGKLK